MKRLTETYKDSTWGLRGVLWDEINAGAELSEETAKKLYGAIWKLKDYEDAGFSPDEVEQMKWKLMDSDL